MENWEKKDRTFAEADKLLINQSLETIDGNFDNLPTTHPVSYTHLDVYKRQL